MSNKHVPRIRKMLLKSSICMTWRVLITTKIDQRYDYKRNNSVVTSIYLENIIINTYSIGSLNNLVKFPYLKHCDGKV